MQWYIPITIIPGIGLLILSTVNLLLSLSNEIATLITNKRKIIASRKIKQLKLLNRALISFYITIALLVISALVNGVLNQLHQKSDISSILAIVGVFFLMIGLINLSVFSIRALRIRQDQFKELIS